MKLNIITSILLGILLNGCTKEEPNDCDVNSPNFKALKTDFEYTVTNNSVSFKNNSVNADTYLWEFGDGKTSTEFQPINTYAYSNKPYTVKLTSKRCDGQRESIVSKTLDVRCQTKAPEIEVDKKTICSGEKATLKLKTSCVSGGIVKWSTGATTNTLTVSVAGKYTAQCVADCPSASSNEIQVAVNPKPNQPSISASSFDVCEGSSFSLPNSTCNIGTLAWSDGTTGLSKTPGSTSTFTVTCSSNGCISQSSAALTLRVLPSKATVSTLDGSGNIVNFNFRGSIDFKTNTIVEDHGFIYKTGLTDTPFKIGDVGVTTISMGSKLINTVNTFNRVLTKPAKNISFIAYIKDCSGYKYGTIKKL